MAENKRFPFYKHLVAMECRKDIILENDFANSRTRDRNMSFISKYKDKITKNKMRIAYLLGFSFVFNLGFIYDTLFNSNIYRTLISQSQRIFLKFDDYRKQFGEVDYNNKTSLQLGTYFRRLQDVNIRKQITSASLSSRIPAFMEIADQPLDVNTFVKFCLQHNISTEQLPNPNTI